MTILKRRTIYVLKFCLNSDCCPIWADFILFNALLTFNLLSVWSNSFSNGLARLVTSIKHLSSTEKQAYSPQTAHSLSWMQGEHTWRSMTSPLQGLTYCSKSVCSALFKMSGRLGKLGMNCSHPGLIPIKGTYTHEPVKYKNSPRTSPMGWKSRHLPAQWYPQISENWKT